MSLTADLGLTATDFFCGMGGSSTGSTGASSAAPTTWSSAPNADGPTPKRASTSNGDQDALDFGASA